MMTYALTILAAALAGVIVVALATLVQETFADGREDWE